MLSLAIVRAWLRGRPDGPGAIDLVADQRTHRAVACGSERRRGGAARQSRCAPGREVEKLRPYRDAAGYGGVLWLVAGAGVEAPLWAAVARVDPKARLVAVEMLPAVCLNDSHRCALGSAASASLDAVAGRRASRHSWRAGGALACTDWSHPPAAAAARGLPPWRDRARRARSGAKGCRHSHRVPPVPGGAEE